MRIAQPDVHWQKEHEWPPANSLVMESIVAATRSRTIPDRVRLGEVADAFANGGVAAVEARLHLSRSQAYRLIKLAREQGHIKEAK